MSLALQCLDAQAAYSGEGFVMDQLRKTVHNEVEAVKHITMIQKAKIEQAVHEVTHHALSNDTGMIPDFEVPMASYHYWPAHYRRKAEEAGWPQERIEAFDFYGIWDDPQFIAEFKRDNPGLVYQEEKVTANSIIVPATRWTKVAA